MALRYVANRCGSVTQYDRPDRQSIPGHHSRNGSRDAGTSADRTSMRWTLENLIHYGLTRFSQ
ncbi:hypothetical protein DSL92_07660 [Billgrantia gudaonensis]|uniref:Uncharacterized protein n=1 Tax=Billgrantia gudaonensis TaxID=376427 RepID=A0A3S0R4M7_9GAMM|nr:hypothetical protein DSL92_07660 [Halomonas gudaonensis]